MADEPGGDPQASAPKRRASRAKTSAEPPATVEASATIEPSGMPAATEHVDVHQAAVGRVEAANVAVEMGAIGAARAEQVRVERGAVGAALGEQVEVSRGYARSILARQVQLDRAAARVVIAADVRTNQTAVMFLVARKVAGEVRVLFDWRGALAFGAAAGLVLALLGRARRRQ